MKRTTSVRRTTSVQRTTSFQRSQSLQKTTSVSETLTVTTLKKTASLPGRAASVNRVHSLKHQAPTQDHSGPSKLQRVPSVKKVATPQKTSSPLKRKSTIPPRPLSIKRQRIKREPFQFDDDNKSAKKRQRTETKEVVFDKGTFLAIRADKGNFYLCQAVQNVYSSARPFKIRWLSRCNDQPSNVYKLVYYDTTEPDCVISKVRLMRAGKGMLKLEDRAADGVRRLLKAAEDGEDVSAMDDSLFEEPAAKRAKKPAPEKKKQPPKEKKSRDKKTPVKKAVLKKSTSKTGSLKKTSSTSSVTSLKKVGSLKKSASKASLSKKPSLQKQTSKKVKSTKAKKERKPREKKPPKEKKPREKKPPKPKVDRSDPNWKLKPNPAVSVLEKDPLFETREKLPFISSIIHSKLIIRAVKLNDMKMLKQLIDDTKQVHKVNEQQALHSPYDGLHQAIFDHNQQAIKLLTKELYEDRRYRVAAPTSLLQTLGTGTYNRRSLGIRNVRKVQLSRGGKEGNNALTKLAVTRNPYVEEAIKRAVPFTILDLMAVHNICSTYDLFQNIYLAVRAGHRKLAVDMIQQSDKAGGVGFNHLHLEALKFDKEDWKGPLRESSVRKKPDGNRTMLPLHCAAINPNVKYLTKLFSVVPEFNIMDDDQRRPIHYAAACTGTGPLEYLINKGMSLDEGDKNGITPLIIACQTGRLHNVELLLKTSKAQQEAQQKENEEDEALTFKFGVANVNKPNLTDKSSWCPIHYAVSSGHRDVVDMLVKYGADVNKYLNATHNKLTPLIIAASNGDLKMVRCLIETHRAKIELRDKLKRSALTHAVREGRANVASYLLSRGADPNAADSSGNTCMHYGAAYGSYFPVKLLLDAGANPDPPNDWKLTPLGASYMKGHLGLTNMLLDTPGVNINFQDEKGMTVLLSSMTTNPLSKEVYQNVERLVMEKHADCTLVDAEGCGALHHLASNPLPYADQYHGDDERRKEEAQKSAQVRKEHEEVVIKLAKLLIDKGCDPKGQNNSKEMPWYKALQLSEGQRYMKLVNLLVEQVDQLQFPDEEERPFNPVRWLARNTRDAEVLKVLRTFSKKGQKTLNAMKKMARECDDNGHTALLEACDEYSGYSPYYHGSDEDVHAVYEKMREFLKFLVETLDSQVEYVFHKKINKDETKPVNKSVLFKLINTNRRESGSQQPTKPAFRMMLKYKPNIDLPSEDGKSLLLAQASTSNTDSLLALLENGADPNFVQIYDKERDGDRRSDETPLLAAFSKPNCNSATHLLEHGARATAAYHPSVKDGNSSLHLLAEQWGTMRATASLEMAKLLLEHGANINAPNAKQRTPLHLSANKSTDNQDESKEMEQLLIKNGGDLFATDVRGRLPLHYLFVKIGSHRSTSRSDPVESLSIFTLAMGYKGLDTQDNFGCSPLHYAAYRGATVCCMMLVQRGCDINLKDGDGNTALSRAVLARHDSCALTLMQKGADINGDIITNPDADKPPQEQEDQGESDEEWEVEEESDDSSRYSEDQSNSDSDSDEDFRDARKVTKKTLKKLKQKPVWKWRPRDWPTPWKPGQRGHPIFQGLVENNWQGLTYIAMDLLEPFGMQYAAAVEIAMRMQKFRFALTLIDKQVDDQKLLVKNDRGQHLLHVMAEATGHDGRELQVKIVEELMRRGVDLNDQDNDGRTCLIYAINNGKFEWLVDSLLGNDAVDVTLHDNKKRTALAACMWKPSNVYHDIKPHTSSQDLVRRLVKRGADLDEQFDFPPVDLLRGGYKPYAQKQDFLVEVNKKRLTGLLVAVAHRLHYVARKLLKEGADVNQADSDGRTPLMYAARLNDALMVKVLMTKDGNFDIEKHCQDLQQLRNDVASGKHKAPSKTVGKDIFAGLKKVKKTSVVDLNVKDNEGKTALHHFLCALPYGVYENLEMLKLLVEAGANPALRDREGKTPMDHILERGSTILARALDKLHTTPWTVPVPVRPQVDDGIAWDTPTVDVDRDAESMLKKLREEEAAQHVDEPLAVPDSRATVEEGEVVMDEDQDIPYDVLMTKVDVRVGEFGLYNFYKMQVIHDTEKDLYILFNCWGRIGDSGQYQRTPYGKVDEAVQNFCKIFKAKAGNDWNKVKEFQVQPKKYRLVDADHREKNKWPDIAFKLESELPSKLHPYVQDVMKELSSISMLNSAMRNTGVDVPFGHLKKEKLIKAREILGQLEPVITQKEEQERTLTTDTLPEYHKLCEKLSHLSSEFYYLVPQRGYEYERLEPIQDKHTLSRYVGKVESLLELEVSGKILLAAQYRAKEINPMDYVYRAMKVQINLMKEDSPESKVIMKYIHATGNVKVEAVYEVAREGESECLDKCALNNHRFLWHGSRTSNLISILKRGLLIAPKNAPATGYMFGKGIYSADTFRKSEGYCHNDGGGRTKYMLLCEVALGKEKKYDQAEYMEQAPAGYNSTCGNGQQIPDPAFTVATPQGVVMSIGPLVDNLEPIVTEKNQSAYRALGYSEYIVYSEDQVALRYIIQYQD